MSDRINRRKSRKLVNILKWEANKALNGLFLCKKFDIRDTVAIFGAPRSGTTWLSDLININLDFLAIYRPMSVRWYPRLSRINIGDRPYCHPDTEYEELEQYLYKVFSGDFQTLGGGLEYSFKTREYLARLIAKKLLIKINSGIRLLPWITSRFQLKEIFLITRHPCATISSQIQAGGQVGYDSIGLGFPTPKMIVNEMKNIDFIEEPLIKKIEQVSKIEERLAAIWALDYLVPFKFDVKFELICYEHLLLNNEKVLFDLFEKLNQANYYDKAIRMVNKPARTTGLNDLEYLTDIELQLNKWKKRLSKDEVSRISKVLSWFEMGFSDNEYHILDNRFNKKQV